MSDPRIGLIGLDSSHVVAFSKLLNDPDAEQHVPGGRIVCGWPGGSPDFDKSASRVDGFTAQLRDDFGIAICDSPEQVAEQADLLFITSCDGRAHRALFERVAPAGKPVFIDKPLACSLADAEAIVAEAERRGLPICSASSLRYADPLVEALAEIDELVGVDVCGPMAIEPTQPGLFWYGIHAVEMLMAALGPGFVDCCGRHNDDCDLLLYRWRDGRLASLRGMRSGHQSFGVLLHGAQGARWVEPAAGARPPYAGLLERVIAALPQGRSPLSAEEMLDTVRAIEAGNRCRER